MLDLVFVADVVLQFFHGFEDRGFPVTELKRVAQRYLRSWFALDCFVAIPFERILAGASWAKPLKLIKTVRPTPQFRWRCHPTLPVHGRHQKLSFELLSAIVRVSPGPAHRCACSLARVLPLLRFVCCE